MFLARIFKSALSAALIASLAVASPVLAGEVIDCPGRDAPFSESTPLIDIFLSPQARAVAERELELSFDKMPPVFLRTDGPSFAAILTLEQAAGMGGKALADVERALAKLAEVPVTDADRAARCARYDNDVPEFDLPRRDGPAILLFEKITGFRDGPSVDAAHKAFTAMAARKGWAIASTEMGGAINADTLSQFDLIVWNNISGDVLTLTQRQALRDFVEGGGGFVAVHGSAGDPSYFWDWYVDTLIGARFAGHPMNPQFQDARVAIEDFDHPAVAGLPGEFTMNDEWYSFKTNPRDSGARVIATLDESTYEQSGRFGESLAMGDHPIAWSKIVGRGRMFYSAMGHRPEIYEDPRFVTLFENAIAWAAGIDDCDCGAARE
ncbi:MAG: ThuA domain-containing protein [Sphingomonadaceae bacterium]